MLENVTKYIKLFKFPKKMLRLGSKIGVKGFSTSGFRKSTPFGLIFFHFFFFFGIFLTTILKINPNINPIPRPPGVSLFIRAYFKKSSLLFFSSRKNCHLSKKKYAQVESSLFSENTLTLNRAYFMEYAQVNTL